MSINIDDFVYNGNDNIIIAIDENQSSSDNFGYSVSISGDYAIVGAYLEYEDASGFIPLSNAGSAYIFGNNDILPVELTSFTASVNENIVSLNWETATEVNNYGFNVERAIINYQLSIINWTKVGFVDGHGNSNSTKNYSFTDNTPPHGVIQYRLKQIDTDGQFEYSDIVEVNVGNTPTEFALYQNYPNPFNPSTTIKFTLHEGGLVTLKIYNILGEEVSTLINRVMEAGSYEKDFNAKALASGVYIYRISAGSFV
ncbi:MAG: T9SS type A sorting domain-containing protein [Ignavibacteriaceae bacterium]|nr:T9SS type A sorting domain-containing protein [Ignavibacteriaceae bacterium]